MTRLQGDMRRRPGFADIPTNNPFLIKKSRQALVNLLQLYHKSKNQVGVGLNGSLIPYLFLWVKP